MLTLRQLLWVKLNPEHVEVMVKWSLDMESKDEAGKPLHVLAEKAYVSWKQHTGEYITWEQLREIRRLHYDGK